MRRDRVATAYAVAYIAGAEVMWRMAHAPIPWQFGKYAICLVLVIALFRVPRMAWRMSPILYFLVLIPSIGFSLVDPALTNYTVMQYVAEWMPAPLVLALSVLFFSQLSVTTEQFKRILLAFVAPAVAVATVMLLATYSAADLTFTDESNFTTSNGFGPNQVSGTLGLGALVSLLYAIGPSVRRGIRWICISLMIVLITETVMTFSRGGLYAFIAGSVLSLPIMLSDRRIRRHVILVLGVVGLMCGLFILPNLDRFTGGTMSTRFEDTSPGRRRALAHDDLLIWIHHPIFGVGPGGSRKYRETTFGPGHTEYTRLLAEHGTFGLVALVLLIGMAIMPLLRSGAPWSRGVRVALVAGSLVSMGTAAMRIAAFCVVLALAHIALRTSTSEGVSPADTLPDDSA